MLKGIEIDVEHLRREIVADRMGATIARKLGIARTYLYRKLSGKIAMTPKDLNRICKVYGRSATEFVKEIDLEDVDLEGLAA